MSQLDDREFLNEGTSERMGRMQADLQRMIAGPDSPTGYADSTEREQVLNAAITACTSRAFKDGRAQPDRNFTRIAELWTSIGFEFKGGSVPPHAVGLAMTALKLARIVDNPSDRDSYVDGAGYLACAWECVEK